MGAKGSASREVRRITATTAYQSLNPTNIPVLGVMNNSGQTAQIRMNSCAGDINYIV